MPKRASEVRADLYFKHLSKIEPGARKDEIVQELEDLYDWKEKELGFKLRPPGPLTTKNREIMIALIEGHVVAALSIEIAPRLEGLVIDPDAEWKQVVFDQLVARTEGGLMATGYDWYDFAIPESFDVKYLQKVMKSNLTWEIFKKQAIKIFRRFM